MPFLLIFLILQLCEFLQYQLDHLVSIHQHLSHMQLLWLNKEFNLQELTLGVTEIL